MKTKYAPYLKINRSTATQAGRRASPSSLSLPSFLSPICRRYKRTKRWKVFIFLSLCDCVCVCVKLRIKRQHQQQLTLQGGRHCHHALKNHPRKKNPLISLVSFPFATPNNSPHRKTLSFSLHHWHFSIQRRRWHVSCRLPRRRLVLLLVC